MTTPPEPLQGGLSKAIDAALEQVRAELIRLYSHGDIGKVEIDCGRDQLRVKALPQRIHEPVKFETNLDSQ